MKKKRGLSRYFKHLSKKNLSIPEVWIRDGFCSYDKLWVDSIGFKGIKKRSPHIDCLVRSFNVVKDKMPSINPRYQIWIWLNETESSQDCIILHSPNSISAFPHKYELYSLEPNFKNLDLVNFINQYPDFNKIFGSYFSENDHGINIKENFCVMYKDGIGEPVV